MGYAVYFDYGNKTYRLPVNPSEITTDKQMSIETYEVLKSGQIAVPVCEELTTYTFEAEFPSKKYHYVETKNGFKKCDYYEKKFNKWMNDKTPIRFIASNGIGTDINTLVLIESLSIVEKAGEEGDKYFSFTLRKYKPYGSSKVVTNKGKKKNKSSSTSGDKKRNSKQTTYVVVKGDTLWAIAKKYYGSGNQYNKIYNANRDKIKNPNLIYPGQKLVIP